MTKRSSIEDLEIAADWLEANEGQDGESEACERVAARLRTEIARRLDRIAEDRAVKHIAQLHDISPRRAREALRQRAHRKRKAMKA